MQSCRPYIPIFELHRTGMTTLWCWMLNQPKARIARGGIPQNAICNIEYLKLYSRENGLSIDFDKSIC